jgi:hypothetical protein
MAMLRRHSDATIVDATQFHSAPMAQWLSDTPG